MEKNGKYIEKLGETGKNRRNHKKTEENTGKQGKT